MLSPDHLRILGYLTVNGIASSDDLQRVTGRSQPTASRLLEGLAGKVTRVGRARATRYLVDRPIRGHAGDPELFWTHENGDKTSLGVLHHLADGRVYVDSDIVPRWLGTRLPWFLAPLRAHGFLGRLHAQRLRQPWLQGDPESWKLEDVLYAAAYLQDEPGAIMLSPFDILKYPAPLPAAPDALRDALDARADDVAQTLSAGSSAGGEQPKFLTIVEPGQHVLVKFTPPRGTPYGERWHDLLHAEALANAVLSDHGVPVAATRIVESARRTFLVSERFDRIGLYGRRHAVYLGDVHNAFIASPYEHWAKTCSALARQGRLPQLEADRAGALLAYGRLIGNSDMHSGNLSLFVELEDIAKGSFSLAPVYDMLPMRWRPDTGLGAADYSPFEPDAAAMNSPAAPIAWQFWDRLGDRIEVGKDLRRVAKDMAKRVRP